MRCVFMMLLVGIKTLMASPICYHLYGQTTCGAGHIPSLHTTGRVTLQQTHIAHDTHVQGSLHAFHAHLGALHVTGPTLLQDTIIDGKTTLIGDVSCKTCTLKRAATLHTRHAEFSNASLQNLYINTSPATHQTVRLNNTTVTGNIVFADQHGILEVCGHSHVAGHVQGAKVIRVPCAKALPKDTQPHTR